MNWEATMAVHFDLERMEQVRQNHMRWWLGELDRPLVKVTIEDMYPARDLDIPVLSQANCTDFRWSAEQVIEALDNDLSRREYLGDAFPMVGFDTFGPGVLAAFCGARLDNSSGAVWFFPQEEMEIEDIHVRYDPNHPIVQRIKDLYRAGLERWQGTVMMGMPDLGGVMDVAATLRGTENLLMDLYDAPEEAIRLNDEIQKAWYEAYEDLAEVLAPQKAFTNWSGLLSTTPSYIIQCDFSYMIENPMFKQFVLNTLKKDTERLDNVIYHLDGVGELNHLDDILSLEKLKAVQWVFGDGQPPAEEWMDVYRRIAAAGKQMWICGTPESYLKVIEKIHGTPYATHSMRKKDMDLARKLVAAR